jgi:hypothetical protein
MHRREQLEKCIGKSLAQMQKQKGNFSVLHLSSLTTIQRRDKKFEIRGGHLNLEKFCVASSYPGNSGCAPGGQHQGIFIEAHV